MSARVWYSAADGYESYCPSCRWHGPLRARRLLAMWDAWRHVCEAAS